jgi:hypothetical protein
MLSGGGDEALSRDDELGRLRNRVRRHLTIAPDCSTIEFTGDQDEYEADLEALMQVALPAGREQGLTSANELSEWMLVQILPDCVIPPEEGFESRPDLLLLFTNMRGRLINAGEALPDVDDEELDAELGEPPPEETLELELELDQPKKTTFQE